MNGAVNKLIVMDPGRAACSAITGYLYQAAWGVLRWLDLTDDQVMLCEGDEDLDRRLRGDLASGVSEQIKHYQRLDKRDFREILANFVRGYVTLKREGSDRRYLLTASCNGYSAGGWAALMKAWDHNKPVDRDAAVPKIAAAVNALVREIPGEPKQQEHAPALLACLDWLDEEDGRWAEFVAAVAWNLQAPSLGGVLAEVEHKLNGRTTLPAAGLSQALLSQVLQVSALPRPEDRALTLAGLEGWLENQRLVLDRWAESATARWLQDLLQRERLLEAKMWSALPGHELLPGQMVQAQYQQVRFDDSIRVQELALLDASCSDADKCVDVLVLTGEGGSGKTRLMIEWCRRLRDEGWQAGFLSDRATDDPPHLLLAPGPPRLLVVDYAESRVAGIERLLSQIHGRLQGNDCPVVRIVLLARQSGSWWQDLRENSPVEVRDLCLSIDPNVHEVQALPDSQEAREAQYLLARESFRLRWPQSTKAPQADLRNRRYGNVLLVQMKALLDLIGSNSATADDILQVFLRHEADYWRKAMEQSQPSGYEPCLLYTSRCV